MEEDDNNTAEQGKKRDYAELRPYQFKRGQSGNPSGKPKGTVSLKKFAQSYIQDLTEEEKLEFLEGINKKDVWEMAEGKAKQDVGLSGNLTISQVLDELDGQEIEGQKMEDKPSV